VAARLLFGAAALLMPLAAGAQKARKTYYVVQIYPEGIDGIVVSLGRGSGARAGQKIRVFRSVAVKHPVTGQKLRDRFPLGDLELIEVGRTLSVCEDLPEEEEYEGEEGKTVSVAKPRRKSRIKVGDQVELLAGTEMVEYASPVEGKKVPWAAAKTAAFPAAGCPEATCPPCPQTASEMDAATAAVLAAWKHSLGNPFPVKSIRASRFTWRSPHRAFSPGSRILHRGGGPEGGGSHRSRIQGYSREGGG